MTIAKTSTISRNERILAADLGEEIVMMDLVSGEYYNMKAVALRVWELIETPKTLAQIMETLRGEYDVDDDTCENEVTAFVSDLRDAGIVTLQ